MFNLFNEKKYSEKQKVKLLLVIRASRRFTDLLQLGPHKETSIIYWLSDGVTLTRGKGRTTCWMVTPSGSYWQQFTAKFID